MSDLDNKLEAIVKNPLYKIVSSGRPNIRDGHAVHDVDGDVAAIKQAFIDAGWLAPIPNKNVGAIIDISSTMTGQEWYDRFEKEMDAISAYATFDNHDDVDRALEAAKRASVLEER